jgi:hypothetical protein
MTKQLTPLQEHFRLVRMIDFAAADAANERADAVALEAILRARAEEDVERLAEETESNIYAETFVKVFHPIFRDEFRARYYAEFGVHPTEDEM